MTYIPRTLTYNHNQRTKTIKDVELLSLNKPVVVLAEPGMGKSSLLNEISKLSNYQLITATSFLRRPKAMLMNNQSEWWLIDALDEMPSKHEGSNIDEVLQKLYDLGSPNFILTCRNIEWRSTNTDIIKDFYGNNIIETHLEAFNRYDAKNFLQSYLTFSGDAEELLLSLDNHNLSSYYENPLTLELLAKSNFDKLLENKADIFEVATQKLWQETNDYATNQLKTFSQSQVIDQAGYIFATYLLTGKQIIFNGNTAKTPTDALNIHELTITSVPLTEILKTRLFKATGEEYCYKPWHRTIAEFLGAKWLAEKMTSVMLRQRILSHLIVNGGVIASLRGLFTWLSYFNSDLAKVIIQVDPYGLIKYADTSNLTDSQCKLLFEALIELSEENPRFRQQDWGWIKAPGLAKHCLLEDFRQVLQNPNSNFNLRLSVIQILQDADFVHELKDDLVAILLDVTRTYSERKDILDLLFEKHIQIDWGNIFDILIATKEHESLRLVLEFSRRNDFQYLTDDQILKLIINSYNLGGNEAYRRYILPRNGSYFYFTNFPVEKILALLNGVYKTVKALNLDPHRIEGNTRRGLNTLIICLIHRYIINSSNTIPPDIFANVITIFSKFDTESLAFIDDGVEFFNDYFKKNLDYKFEIQKKLIQIKPESHFHYPFGFTVLHALIPTEQEEKIRLLLDIQNQKKNEKNLKIWKQLVRLLRGDDGISNEAYQLALPYAQNDKELKKILDDMRNPTDNSWLFEMNKSDKWVRRKKKVSIFRLRNRLQRNIAKLESGNYHFCEIPAQIILNQYFDDIDIPRTLSEFEKLEFVLGKNLSASANKGFEASLKNQQYSMPLIVDAHIDRQHYRIESVMIAGIFQRIINGQSLDDLTDEIILTCGAILEFGHFMMSFYQEENIIQNKVREQINNRSLKETFVNALLDPQFERNSQNIGGIHWLINKQHNIGKFEINKIITLLYKYPNMDKHDQRYLIDTLINHKAFSNIHDLVLSRVNDYIPYESDDIKPYARWLALASYVDEPFFLKKVQCFEQPEEIFWQLSELFSNKLEDGNLRPSLRMLVWVVYRFSNKFPKVYRPQGVSSGNRNDWQATEFVDYCLVSISNITSQHAREELTSLQYLCHPSYQEFIVHLLAQQAVKIRETFYQPLNLPELLAIYEDKSPNNCIDLKALVIQLLNEIQAKIKGNETDTYKVFYKTLGDTPTPQDENYCRDRLTDLLELMLTKYQFECVTERDMPNVKRADIVCQNSHLKLPIEIKGQWHKDLYISLNDQLGDYYLKEFQSQGQGIYFVFWFGNNINKALRKLPNSECQPQTPIELQALLKNLINTKYKQGIDVFVMDVSID